MTCNICFEILVVPIKLKCNHEFCIICAESLIENENFKCPMCRSAIAEVYHSNMRLLLDGERWNEIKKTFPNEVFQRLNEKFSQSLLLTKFLQFLYKREMDRCAKSLEELKKIDSIAVRT